MKCHSRVRGVVVSTTAVGESNSGIRIYTEAGLLYAMAYGGRSVKSSVRGSNALFTMGNFALEQNKSHYYKIYDILVYEHCYELSSSLPCYYAACACVELVRYLEGSQHDMQFKTLIDVLLYLVSLCRGEKGEHSLRAHAALLVYLWRSLCYNGWHPQKLNNSTKYAGVDYFSLDMVHGAFVPSDTTYTGNSSHNSYISRQYIDILQQTLDKPFSYSADCVWHSSTSHAQKGKLRIAGKHLLQTWEQVLERTLRSVVFVSS